MTKIRFQICTKLPYLVECNSMPLGDQIIEVPKKNLPKDQKEAIAMVLDLAREQLFKHAEIYVEELEKHEELDMLRFSNHSKRENTKPITFLKG